MPKKLPSFLIGIPIYEGVQRSTQYYPRPPVHGRITPATSCPLDPTLD